MKKLFWIGLLLASQYIYGATALDANLQQFINHEQVKLKVNAISLSVSLPRQNSIHNYVTGTLSKNNKTPITPNNLFQVGSITKNFTALLIMQLISAGKLQLDAPLGTYLPQYPKWEKITIRQLLNNTSGIYDYIDEPHWWEQVMDHPHKIYHPEQLLKIAYQHKPYFAPNQGWHYSNSNYLILGLVIEKLSNKSIQHALQQLLDKANLHNSYFMTANYSIEFLQQMVHGYYQDIDNTEINGSWGSSAAALISTPNQIVLWVQTLFNKAILSNQELLMVEQAVSVTTGQPSNDFSKTAYGLGMFRMNTPAGLVWFTPGLTPGYRSIWVLMPCYNISFAYSVSNSLIGIPIHEEMMRQLIPTILNDKAVQHAIKKYQQQANLPDYCRTLAPSKEWSFVSL
ncbi:MAG: serine hydrolase domain-containing protein [Legionella sp.]